MPQRRFRAGCPVAALGHDVETLAGFCLTGLVLFARLEAPPGDEGVLPAPTGLWVDERGPLCGSGGCGRQVDAIGTHVHEQMRAHLAMRGFTSRRPGPVTGQERMCRQTGLVATHEVCAELQDVAADTVRVSWYID